MRVLSQILLFTLLIIFSGCSASKLKPKIDKTLPVVTDIKTLSDVNSIAFEWTPVKDARVEGYFLYRGSDGVSLKQVAKINDRFSSHFVDET